MPRRQKARGRPPVRLMPERIDATPEQIAEAFLRLPADYDQRYLKDAVGGEKDSE